MSWVFGGVPDGSTTLKGKVQFATDGETTALEAVQGSDTRLQNRNRQRGCKVTHSANQSCANFTLVVLAYDTERYDYPGWHSTVTNNSRITVDVAGTYICCVSFAYATNGTGERAWDIRINGSNYIVGTTLNATIATNSLESANGPAVHHECAANDYFETVALQISGGALNVNKSANYSPEMSVSLQAA